MNDIFTFVVATPSLNQGEYISKTINSIWRQKGNFYIRHVVADGGSDDNTVKILKRFQDKLEKKTFKINCRGISFEWSSEKDRGQSAVISKIFKKNQGDLFAWLNSDDYYSSNTVFQKIKDIKCKHDPDIITGNANYVSSNGSQIEQHFSAIIVTQKGFIDKEKIRILENYDIFAQPSTFVDNDIIMNNPLDVKLFFGMDWDLWIRCYKGGATFYKVNEVLSCMRRHANAKTNSFGLRFYREKDLLYKKHKIINANSIHSKIKIIQLSSNSLLIQRLISLILNCLITVKRIIFGRNTIIG